MREIDTIEMFKRRQYPVGGIFYEFDNYSKEILEKLIELGRNRAIEKHEVRYVEENRDKEGAFDLICYLDIYYRN